MLTLRRARSSAGDRHRAGLGSGFRTTRAAVVSALLAAAILPGAAACGAGGTGGTGGKSDRILAAFYPMGWLAERIAGGHATVGLLTKPGAEPHDLELTPRQIVEVGEARLVIYVKGVQPAVDKAVAEHAAHRALDATSVVKTLGPPPGGEGGAALSYDPHVWLDPGRMAQIATAVGERLAKADPADAAAYRANAGSVVSLLTTLDGEFRAGLARCSQRTIVTSHAAFGYLADRYGLTQMAIAGLDPQAEPSLRRITELARQVKETKVTTIFTETLVSPKVAQSLAAGAGVGTAVLDPVEAVAAGSGDDYVSIMRRNLQTLRTALKCS